MLSRDESIIGFFLKTARAKVFFLKTFPLWPDGEPDWYREARIAQEKWLAEGEEEQELDETADDDPERVLRITIDPGDAPAELISELYASLNALYRAEGGSGLKILREKSFEMIGVRRD